MPDYYFTKYICVNEYICLFTHFTISLMYVVKYVRKNTSRQWKSCYNSLLRRLWQRECSEIGIRERRNMRCFATMATLVAEEAWNTQTTNFKLRTDIELHVLWFVQLNLHQKKIKVCIFNFFLLHIWISS